MALSRTEVILQSLQSWLVSHLAAQGYTGLYEMTDTYPQGINTPLDKTIVVVTAENDLPNTPGEIGGPLFYQDRVYAVDVLGSTEKLGQNIAGQIAEKLSNQDRLPMYDFSSGSAVLAQNLFVASANTLRLRFSNPRPWQRFWYQVTTRIEDEYNVTYS